MAIALRSSLILLACAAVASGGPAVAKKSHPIVLTDSANYSVTRVHIGEPVEIRLKAQGGTGFSWFPTSSAAKVSALSPLKATRPGGTEMQRFRFKSKRPGNYVVGFTYGQPWKGGTKGAKSRSFTIKVR